jgi:hypothetical protein
VTYVFLALRFAGKADLAHPAGGTAQAVFPAEPLQT